MPVEFKTETKFEGNPEGWSQLTKEIINKHGVPAMQRVANACNEQLAADRVRKAKPNARYAKIMAKIAVRQGAFSGQDGAAKGFMVSVEGDDPLEKRDYRATVITASWAAMRHNARHNTLLRNFHHASR